MKNIIKPLALAVGFLLLVQFVYSEEKKPFRPKFSLKLTGGWGYTSIGDLNTYLDSYDSYLVEMTDYQGGQIKRLNTWLPDFEGELRLDIIPKLAVGVGLGRVSTKSKSDFEFVGPFPFLSPYMYDQKYSINSKINSIPLKLGVYYTFLNTSAISISINSGIDFYFSEASFFRYHYSNGSGAYQVIYTKEERYKMTSKGIGLHTGFGIEFGITKHFAFVFEAQGRFARIKNLKAEKISILYSDETKEEGILFIGERQLPGYGVNCPDLIVSASMPTGQEYKNIREAALDFSGFSLRGGIVVRLY